MEPGGLSDVRDGQRVKRTIAEFTCRDVAAVENSVKAHTLYTSPIDS